MLQGLFCFLKCSFLMLFVAEKCLKSVTHFLIVHILACLSQTECVSVLSRMFHECESGYLFRPCFGIWNKNSFETNKTESPQLNHYRIAFIDNIHERSFVNVGTMFAPRPLQLPN